MNIYIQIDENYIPYSDFVYTAYQWFKYDITHNLNYFMNIDEVPVSKQNMIIGSINNTIAYFNKLKVNVPKPLNIPDELNKEEFIQRQIYVKTIEEFKNWWRGDRPIFIKPNDILKLFTGGVITKNSSKSFLDEYDTNTNLLVSEYIDMSSEYRCFINKKKLVGIKHYNSDFNRFLDTKIVLKCIEAYKCSPVSYSLDFAVTDDNRTVLIEANDGWSLAAYGLDSETYCRFLIDRWLQIIK